MDFEAKIAQKEFRQLDSACDEAGRLAKYLLPDAVVDIESLGRRAIIFNNLCGPSVHEYTKGLPDGRLPWAMVQTAVSDTTDAVEYLHCCHIGHGGEQTFHIATRCS